MKELNFKHGNGKTTDLCLNAYQFRLLGTKVIIMNATNQTLISKIEENGVRLLRADIDAQFDSELLFEKAIKFKEDNVSTIFVDNAEYLKKEDVEQLFYIAKILNIPVYCYGNRTIDGCTSEGSIRLMELANNIERANGITNTVHQSRLQFYYGAMNCKKTTKLLIKSKELEAKGLKIFTIRPSADRDAINITSRIGLKRKADLVVNKERLYGLGQYLYASHINYILIDEAQFLSEEQIEDLYKINRDYNIPIECYGLRTDFLIHAFSGSKRLLEIADDLICLKIACGCSNHNDVIFNFRQTIDGSFLKAGNQIAIDNTSNYKYVSVCEECYITDFLGIDINSPKKLVKMLEEKF
ncbi:MAG: hypothetical protein RR404_01550 [Bacilli bacterium]